MNGKNQKPIISAGCWEQLRDFDTLKEQDFLFFSFTAILLFSSVLAMAGAAAGVYISSVPDIARRIVPLSGAVLLVISLFLVLPELVESFGPAAGIGLMLAGVMIVWLIDRFIYPVCPACSHTHDHDSCSTRLHGFATPLIIAAVLHSVFDGWALALSQDGGAGGLRSAIAAGILIHKIPESLAYGVILRAALRSKTLAMFWALIAQGATVGGAILALALAPVLGSAWIGAMLALGGGTFLYLGFHAVHSEWKRRAAVRPVQIAK